MGEIMNCILEYIMKELDCSIETAKFVLSMTNKSPFSLDEIIEDVKILEENKKCLQILETM
jgi:hypothetical protein